MNHVLIVGILEGFCDLADDAEHMENFHGRAGLKNVLERLAGNELHHDVMRVGFGVLQCVVDGDDARMGEATGSPRFAHEHLNPSRHIQLGQGI